MGSNRSLDNKQASTTESLTIDCWEYGRFISIRVSTKIFREKAGDEEMIKSLLVLAKVFLLIELAISSIAVVIFLFFEGLSYLSEGAFYFDNLWQGLRGATFGAIPASLILWFFYYLIPTLKK